MEQHEFPSSGKEELYSMNTFEKDNGNENNIALYYLVRGSRCSKSISFPLPQNPLLSKAKERSLPTAELSSSPLDRAIG